MPIIHTEAVLARVREQAGKAAEQMAEAAQSAVLRQMESGYGKPIRRTGSLMADVQVTQQGAQASVGNTLTYAPFVHGGTSRMAARPYLADALAKETEHLKTIVVNCLAELDGMDA